MPIRPQPTTYHCPACGWSKTTAPRRDVLMPGDMPETCPACQHTPPRPPARQCPAGNAGRPGAAAAALGPLMAWQGNVHRY